MASLSTMLSRPAPARVSAARPSSRTSRLVVKAADGSRQDQKAKYVEKQDKAQARNPALEKNVSNVRKEEHSSGAYGATNQEKDSARSQAQRSDHNEDALHPVDKLKEAVGLGGDDDKK